MEEVDDLVAELQRDGPTYRALYYRWERQQWEAGLLDFEADEQDWTHRLFPEQRSALLWLLASSTSGEKQMSQTLVAFVDAAPSEEQGVFLTTQLADTGRHAVLNDRFGEAIGEDLNSLSIAQAPSGPSESGAALEALANEIAEILRLNRDAEEDLVRGICVQHLLAQGVVALTARRFLLRFLESSDVCPGLRRGLMAQMRDSIRHIQFGIRFVAERADSYRSAVDGAFDRAAPMALNVLQSPTSDLEPLAFDDGALRDYSYEQLAARARSIGIDWSPPGG